jgi:hypothetical protein
MRRGLYDKRHHRCCWPSLIHRERHRHDYTVDGGGRFPLVILQSRDHHLGRDDLATDCWHLGGAQSDVASLTAEDVDWPGKVVSFHRHKTGTVSIMGFRDGQPRRKRRGRLS